MQARRRLRTNAKVNLSLRVLGKRADGFHEIESVFQTISLADDMTLTPLDEPGTSVTMLPDASWKGELPRPGTNLVERAADALARAGVEISGVDVTITKRIPVGAGLGGGSANAAGALVALNEMWNAELEKDRLVEIAAEVGSDVPYCLEGGTVLVTGRGEKLSPLPAPPRLWFVLGISHKALPTGDVYEAWEGSTTAQEVQSAEVAYALGAGDPAELGGLLHNDLEVAAFSLRPELPAQREALLDAGALGASLSGSGPTLFGLAEGEDHAHSLAAQVKDVFDRVEVVASAGGCIERKQDAS